MCRAMNDDGALAADAADNTGIAASRCRISSARHPYGDLACDMPDLEDTVVESRNGVSISFDVGDGWGRAGTHHRTRSRGVTN